MAKVEERLLSGLRSHDGRRSGAIDVAPQPIRIHASVVGLVQGVGFRYSAVSVARRLHATGWVRNEHDGSVVVEAQGNKQTIDDMTAWLHEGPQWARVDTVTITRISPVAERSFMVR